MMALRGLLESPLSDRLTDVRRMEAGFAAEAERVGADAAGRAAGTAACREV